MRLGSIHVPVRYCAAPNCSEVVDSGRCPTHRTQRERWRGSAHARGYTSQWDAWSKAFLAEFPVCGMRPNGQSPVMSECYTRCPTTLMGRNAATQTDHVIPHRGDHTLFLDREGNWQALCASCGAAKSGRGL